MAERPRDRTEKPAPPDPAPPEQEYTDDEEAEVRKRLEDLGYVEESTGARTSLGQQFPRQETRRCRS
jgi:hypothetical protein